MKHTTHTTAIRAAAAAVTLALATACSQEPAQEVAVQPQSAATTEAPSAAAAPSAPVSDVSIFYAQVGNRLNESGYIAESLPVVAVTDAVHAMGVFKGRQGASADAGLRVTDTDGREVFSESRSFTVEGEEVPVVFDVATAKQGLRPGSYKALFTLDGGGVWEIDFKVQ